MTRRRLSPAGRRWVCCLLALAASTPAAVRGGELGKAEVVRVSYTLEFFAVDPQGNAWGAAGRTLYRVVSTGDSAQAVAVFPSAVQGIHVMRNGMVVVSTDDDRWDPHKPCRIYLSRDGGVTFRVVKTLPESCALWWSMTSDRSSNLYVGEYGPRAPYQSKSVWRSADYGKTWKVVFHAPNLDGVHIHRVAVDPYTDDLWVTYGDRATEGMYLSRDHGATWTWVRRSQPTSVAFAEDAIYWGEDTVNGVVTRRDRATGRVDTVLQASRRGNYGGSVYDMAKGKTGLVYAPMVKYAEQNHQPALWVGRGTDWQLLMATPSQPGKAGGFAQISPPDRDGFLYVRGYKIRDASAASPAGRPAVDEPVPLPVAAALEPNHPNPFNAWTVLSYLIPAPAPVRLTLYNAAGQRVRTLVDGNEPPGRHRIEWDGTDDQGRPAASGLYLCRMVTPAVQQTRPLLLLR